MTYNQVQNLLGFYMNINNVIIGQTLLECSPDYIEEKWKYWIGTYPTVKRDPLDKSVMELKWCNKWKVDMKLKKYKELGGIISFIISYNSLDNIEIKKLIDLYEKDIGNPDLISNKPLNFRGLHYFLKETCNDILEQEVNKNFMRDIKLKELLT